MRKRQEYKKHPPSRLTMWGKRSAELISITRNLNLMKQVGEQLSGYRSLLIRNEPADLKRRLYS